MARGPGRNDPCPCGSGKKYKRCCLDRDRVLARTDRAVEPQEPTQSYTLVVETATGGMARRIPDASPLRAGVRPGTAAEIATADAAAVWGLPDFVFRAGLHHLGSGVRELGDGIVVVGDIGLVVQVKCREEPSSDAAKEERWARKKAAQALSQANGTIRLLRETPSTVLTSRRGRTVAVEGNSIAWTPVVVLDHPGLPAAEGVIPEVTGMNPAAVLLRRDWEFLFDQLKSTAAVVGYLERVAGEAIPLGNEPVRYYELAQGDASTPPSPINPKLFGGRGRQDSTPLLPLAPADPTAQRMVRLILEDIAVMGVGQASGERERLEVLAELDRIPVNQREETGRFLEHALEVVSQAEPQGVHWRLRQVMGPDESVLLGFGACSHPMDEDIRAAFSSWVSLRHHEAQQALGSADLRTVAILISPRIDGLRPWDTTLASHAGDLDFTPEEIDLFASVWRRAENVVDPTETEQARV